jgi:hypothetical protein
MRRNESDAGADRRGILLSRAVVFHQRSGESGGLAARRSARRVGFKPTARCNTARADGPFQPSLGRKAQDPGAVGKSAKGAAQGVASARRYAERLTRADGAWRDGWTVFLGLAAQARLSPAVGRGWRGLAGVGGVGGGWPRLNWRHRGVEGPVSRMARRDRDGCLWCVDFQGMATGCPRSGRGPASRSVSTIPRASLCCPAPAGGKPRPDSLAKRNPT